MLASLGRDGCEDWSPIHSARATAQVPAAQVLYSISCERMFCGRLRYHMSMVDDPFDASSFSRNRDRPLEHEVARRFLQEVVSLAESKRLMSSEHFSVDGTFIQAWASQKSFRPKDEDDDNRGDGNGWADFVA